MHRGFRSIAGLIIIVGMCIIGVIYREDVFKIYSKYYDSNRKNITITNFEYSTPDNYNTLNLTSDFIAKNKDQLKDIYYTVVNSGNDRFTFYCDVDYENCLIDIEDISANAESLSIINNFVHPFNSFTTIKTIYSSSGKVDLEIVKNYTSEEIIFLNQVIKNFISNNITPTMTDREKIKVVHDYIIENTEYDKTHDLKSKNNTYKSNTAYGVFANKKGICSGYTDAIALFLYEFNIDTFKIASEEHIWNYVILDNEGYHLDATWDDPVMSSGESKIEYFFFLITDEEMDKISKEDHDYNKTLYDI